MKDFSLYITFRYSDDRPLTIEGLSEELFILLRDDHEQLDQFLLQKCTNKNLQAVQSVEELEISSVSFIVTKQKTIDKVVEYVMIQEEPSGNQHWQVIKNPIDWQVIKNPIEGKVKRLISAHITFSDNKQSMTIQVPGQLQEKLLAASGKVIMKEIILSRFNKFRSTAERIKEFSELNVQEVATTITMIVEATLPVTKTQKMHIYEVKEFESRIFQY